MAGAPRRLAQLGSQTMLQMMLVDNLIHSDLHPGNILVALVRRQNTFPHSCGYAAPWTRPAPAAGLAYLCEQLCFSTRAPSLQDAPATFLLPLVGLTPT